ncbi:MAG: HlyD family secretion protein, partial [Verrucomicrobiae bacterium]|nr:HlyD family secretion protein [Verrucomicrobiae bacterium]
DLTIKRTELRTELEELRNQMALNQESNRADMKYDLTTPIAGPVWHRHVVNGEAVVEDQLVAEVVDPDSLFVEAYFRRDFLSRIAIGDHASVFVVGEPRFIEGKVADIRVQESGARQNRAVNVTEPDQYMITATIEIDRREADLEDIGRFVKVLVSSHGKTSWIERGQIWLSLVLRSHRDS